MLMGWFPTKHVLPVLEKVCLTGGAECCETKRQNDTVFVSVLVTMSPSGSGITMTLLLRFLFPFITMEGSED